MNILFKLFLTSILFISSSIWAGQIAVTKSEHVIIYADPQLKVPIGRLSRGKEIIVGNDLKMKGQVATIIVSRRVAYLKTKDLILFRESSPLAVTSESTIKDIKIVQFAKQKDDSIKLKFKSSFSLSLPTLTKSFTNNAQLNQNSSLDQTTTGILLTGNIEMWPYRFFGHRFGVDYIQLHYDNFTERGFGFHYGAIVYITYFKYFKLGLSGDLFLFPYTWIDDEVYYPYNGNVPITYTANMYGFNILLFAEFALPKQWQLRLGMGYIELKTSTYTADLEFSSSSSTQLEIPPLSNRGMILYAGLSYNF